MDGVQNVVFVQVLVQVEDRGGCGGERHQTDLWTQLEWWVRQSGWWRTSSDRPVDTVVRVVGQINVWVSQRGVSIEVGGPVKISYMYM